MLSRKRIVMVSNAIKTHEESPCGERALQIEKAVLRRHARPPRPHRVAHRAHHTRTSSNRAPKRPCHPRAVSSARDARLSRTTNKAPFRRKNRERQHSTSASVPRLREPRVPRNAVASRYTKTVEFGAPSFIRDSGRHDGSSVTRILLCV